LVLTQHRLIHHEGYKAFVFVGILRGLRDFRGKTIITKYLHAMLITLFITDGDDLQKKMHLEYYFDSSKKA
jgi:hypothetical protein